MDNSFRISNDLSVEPSFTGIKVNYHAIRSTYLQELIKFLGKVFYNKVKQRRAEITQEEMSKTMCGSRSKKKLNSKGNTNINTINIQINTGNTRDNIINSTKDSKSKMNFTTTGTI